MITQEDMIDIVKEAILEVTTDSKMSISKLRNDSLLREELGLDSLDLLDLLEEIEDIIARRYSIDIEIDVNKHQQDIVLAYSSTLEEFSDTIYQIYSKESD